jgi:hypothetical protein
VPADFDANDEWDEADRLRPRLLRGDRPPGSLARRAWFVLGTIAGVLVLGTAASVYYIDYLWFDSLGYAGVFERSVLWMSAAGAAGFAAGVGIVIAIARAAGRLMYVSGLDVGFQEAMLGLGIEAPHLTARGARLAARAVAVFVGLWLGGRSASSWRLFAIWWNSAPTGRTDPVLGADVSFYLFTLPVLDHVLAPLGALSIVATVLLLLLTLFAAAFTEDDKAYVGRVGTSVVSYSAAIAAALLSIQAYLGRYDYLLADHGLFSGVSYADDHVRIPAVTFLAGLLLVVSVVLAVNGLRMRRRSLLPGAAMTVLVAWLAALVVWPAVVQQFYVQPTELLVERQYIENNIAATRSSYGIDAFEERPFDTGQLTAAHVRANKATIEAIPLWDWHALYPTLRQIQQFKPYYDFKSVDVDRYTVDGQLRQVMLSAREVSLSLLPPKSINWINTHLRYTHGNGVTACSVSGFTPEGLPELLLRDVPVASSAPGLAVTQPEIYYGEAAGDYAFVHTRQAELAGPGDADVEPAPYVGSGIRVGGLLRRLLLGWVVGDVTEVLLSDYITSDSLLLIHRNVEDRVTRLVPFLTYDPDPYIVIREDGSLVWMIDAFTSSARYPCAKPWQLGRQRINYIRNSVKVTVDAATGETRFYIFDPADPIAAAAVRLFPELFHPAAEMPADIRAHIRYPRLLIELQADVFAQYHMTDPQAFYNNEDLWAIASETRIDDNGQHKQVPLDPYYVLLSLPGENAGLEFVGILPFTPVNRQNMAGWLAARSDGDAYGKVIIYRFPQSRLVTGPQQIESRIDQDREVSAQISLWNQQGSRVVRGHLLVVPTDNGLLFVEPIFLQAQKSPMPELRLIALATEDRLVFGKTYQEALDNLFPGSGQAVSPPPVVPSEPQRPAPTQTIDSLAAEARQALEDYRRHTAEGRHVEAGQALERLAEALEKLAAARR